MHRLRNRPVGKLRADSTRTEFTIYSRTLFFIKNRMKPSFVFVAFALLSTVVIAQAFVERKDGLSTERDRLNLERRSHFSPRSGLYNSPTTNTDLPMMKNIVAVYSNSTNPGTNNTDGVLVSSTCASVLLFGTDLFMGAAFAAMIIPILLEILGFAGNVHKIRCRKIRICFV